MYCDVWAGLSVRMLSPSALEGVGVARGLSQGHFVCRRHAASKPSHFIARGLVNQPCWWAHCSSEARGLVTQPWAHHSCMLAWPLHVDHVGLDVHDVSMGAGMRGGTLVHNEGLPFNKGNDGRSRESRDVEYHCVGAWNIYVMQHISSAVGYFKTRLVGWIVNVHDAWRLTNVTSRSCIEELRQCDDGGIYGYILMVKKVILCDRIKYNLKRTTISGLTEMNLYRYSCSALIITAQYVEQHGQLLSLGTPAATIIFKLEVKCGSQPLYSRGGFSGI